MHYATKCTYQHRHTVQVSTSKQAILCLYPSSAGSVLASMSRLMGGSCTASTALRYDSSCRLTRSLQRFNCFQVGQTGFRAKRIPTVHSISRGSGCRNLEAIHFSCVWGCSLLAQSQADLICDSPNLPGFFFWCLRFVANATRKSTQGSDKSVLLGRIQVKFVSKFIFEATQANGYTGTLPTKLHPAMLAQRTSRMASALGPLPPSGTRGGMEGRHVHLGQSHPFQGLGFFA